jgi:microcystin-dependent protein
MEPFIGQIIMFAGNFAPRGWAICGGQALSITQHAALFSILGTQYGGDGRTNFKLPDLRGRVPMGMGLAPGLSQRSIGEQIGEELVTLRPENLAAHTHAATTTVSGTLNSATIRVSNEPGDSSDPEGRYLASSGTGRDAQEMYSSTHNATLAADAIQLSGSTSSASTEIAVTGDSAPHTNLQPSLVMNYIICLEGVYPARD